MTSVLRQGTALALGLAACGAPEGRCLDGEAVWDAVLPRVFCVEGDLDLAGRPQEEIERLQGLVEITGSLLLQDDPACVELPAFPSLRRIGGSLGIAGNEALAVVRGFPALEELSGELYVGENGSLSAFTLGDRPLAAGAVFFALNQSLTELQLPLARVDGDFVVMAHDHLETLAAPALTAVGRDFVLANNLWLETIDFSALRTAENWTLAGNAKLVSLAGFPALSDVAIAVLTDNDALKEIHWSAAVADTLFIGGNDALERIDGEPPRGPLWLNIDDNLALRGVSGFSAVGVLDRLSIQRNPALVELDAFPTLDSVGTLTIIRNQTLRGPEDWLPALREVTGNLSIYSNARLPPAVVDALLERVQVGGSSRVGDNEDQVTELDPCPWPTDGICDESLGSQGVGTGLCANDPEDCEPVQPPP